ncbi:peflin-like [Diorhabda sublineata]|uniref:peflin-like n=1 Tax=Diorhabda sublineata TaxID=1163346 RepID=UPI0024E04820|nr:peflin-like [Diorhabda sublineata]
MYQNPGGYGGYNQGGFAPRGYAPQPQGGSFTPPAGYAPPAQAGYGQAPQVHPDVQSWFQAVDKDRSGQITWEELQSALINGQGERFSPTACKLMISMFDSDRNGTIGVNEFQSLYNYINQWLAVFKNYDRDQSGSIDEPELAQAFQQMGFRFSPDFIKFLIAKSDIKTRSRMSVDQFIVICIQIQQFTEAFKKRDTEMKGVVTLGFEDFLSIALSCSP